MGWLFKNVLRLSVLGGIAFVGYAFFADLPAPVETRTVELGPAPAGE